MARDDRYNLYWKKFERYLKDTGSTLTTSRSTRRNGRTFIHVTKGLDIAAIPALSDGTCSVEVLLDYTGNKAYKDSDIDYNRDAFKQLDKQKQAIESELDPNLKLDWIEWPEKARSKKPRAKISCCKEYNFSEEPDSHEHYRWFIETVIEFDRVFTHRLKDIARNR